MLAEATRRLWRFLVGRPLANAEYGGRKIGPALGFSSMGLDGLASSAYGPEAALAVLMPLGGAGIGFVTPIMLTIIAVLAVLFTSYWQTIRAYPVNGGSYTVARTNLGTNAGLLAAAALMLDYLLNVAVAISAGVAALISAVPGLHAHMLPLDFGVLLVLTVANLRGLREAGALFAVPTYLFVGCFAIIIVTGLAKALLSHGEPAPVVAPPPPGAETVNPGLLLLLRAFASGCTAMTGVEAVSNGVSAFREPTVANAHRTLAAIVALLAALLAGIAYLTGIYQIGAMNQLQPGYQSVLSQLVAAVMGRGAFYYVSIASLLALLCLSANTSFVDFPRLCRIIARDEFLPRGFAVVGRRLVFSVGILFLAAFAALLIFIFGGITDRLIPLFAVGAFTAFTLSQAGMTVHWYRELRRKGAAASGHRRWQWLHLTVNGVGALTSGGTLIVILVAKFTEGAWMTVIVVPALFVTMKLIRQYYSREESRLHEAVALNLSERSPPVVVIPVEGWNRLIDKAIEFACRLTPDVIAVHLTEIEGPDVEEHEQRLRKQWAQDVERPARDAGRKPPRLVFVRSPYRRFVTPFLDFVAKVEAEESGRTVAVLIPEIRRLHWWENLLHGRRARRLRNRVLEHGDSRLMVMTVPLHFGPSPPRAAEDEPMV